MHAWQITKKDVRLLLRDRRTMFVLVALPLLFITILGFSAGQLFSEKEKAKKMRLGVVNDDTSEQSETLISEVAKIQALEITPFTDRQRASELLADGKIEVLVLIGEHYHERVDDLEFGDVLYPERGKLKSQLQNLDIEVRAGPFLLNAGEIAEALVFAFAIKTIARDVLDRTDHAYAEKLFLRFKRLAGDQPENEQQPAKAESVAGKSHSQVVYQFLVPSYTVMFVFFIVSFMARSLIGERDAGTLGRLLIAPITRSGLMIGKTVPFVLMSLVQTMLLFLAGKLLFQMSWGDYPWMLLPVMVCTSLAATALGLLVATAVRTESQVTAYATFLVLTLAGLSGCLMPRSWQPELMQNVGLATPHAWALIAYDHLLNRDFPNLPVVWQCCGMLLAFAAGFFALGWLRFRKLE